MVHIIVCSLRGERQQIFAEETPFSVEKLKEHLGILAQGCFLSSILRDKDILDDATDLAGFPQPVEVNLIQHPSHWSPMLLSAAHRQDISEVESALRSLADPNSQDDNAWTAICFAALHGNLNMVKLLRKAGADCELGPDENAALHFAVRGGYLPVVDYLVAQRCDVNGRDSYGVSPLQAAAEEGDNELVPALCDFCADLDAADDEEVTPLLAACCRGEVSVVKTLLDRRAEVSNVTRTGASAQSLLLGFLESRPTSAEKVSQARDLLRDLDDLVSARREFADRDHGSTGED